MLKPARFPTVLASIALALAAASSLVAAQSDILARWSRGLGAGPYGRLAFRFEVTFMKIDVADVEARVGPAEAAALGALTKEGKRTRERTQKAAELLMAAETVAFRFTFLREGGLERFLAGTRKNLEASRKADEVTEQEYETIWNGFQHAMSPLQERGAFKQDQLLYRVERDSVRMSYIGPEGVALIDTVYPGKFWANGIKASFLCPGSSFQEKLIRTLWEK